MATAKKVTYQNFKPQDAEGSLPVLATQFNELVDVVNDLSGADGTIQADIITEETSGTGVTVDGVLLKDGYVYTDVVAEGNPNNGVAIDGVVCKDGAVTPDNGVVTQITSITTGVTLSKPAGVITTVTATTAGLAASTFTVTNTFATTTGNIVATIVNYSGTIITNGVPSVIVDNRTAGTFDIIIYNAHATNALNGTLAIAFTVLK